MKRYALLCLLAPALFSGLSLQGETLTLNFYDTNGASLSFSQVQSLQVGPGKGAHEADALIDPATLRLVKATPMTEAGSLSFPFRTHRPVAFAINWPTATEGYGLVIVDNGGQGYRESATINFTYQAACDARQKLDSALSVRPDYKRSAAFTAAYQTATNHLAIGEQSAEEPVKGAQGQLALDQLAVAYDLLLKEYGPVYARAHLATAAPWLGFTMEDISHNAADLDKLAAMAGPYAWVRFVFQTNAAPADYAAPINYAKAKGIKILGLPVDSSQDKACTREQYFQRCTNLIATFPAVDVWEVGNEVNGDWCSPDIAARVADVAAYCKAHDKKTYLTLFWQLNTAEPADSLFNWIAANLPPAVRSNLDYVGLSQYQEQAPVGLAFDRVMRQMQKEFPNQQLGLGELGYWIPDQRYWWAYSPDVTRAKHAILDQYYRAALGYPRSSGGGFWWNFAAGGSDHDFDPTMTESVTRLKNELLAVTPAPAVSTNGSPARRRIEPK